MELVGLTIRYEKKRGRLSRDFVFSFDNTGYIFVTYKSL